MSERPPRVHVRRPMSRNLVSSSNLQHILSASDVCFEDRDRGPSSDPDCRQRCKVVYVVYFVVIYQSFHEAAVENVTVRQVI